MKVLVVDDNIAIQEILKDILIEDGQIVRIAGTIDDAVDAILDFEPDAILLDTTVNDEDGMQILARAHERNHNLELDTILVKGPNDETPKDSSFIKGVVIKPFKSSDISAALKALVAKKEEEKALAAMNDKKGGFLSKIKMGKKQKAEGTPKIAVDDTAIVAEYIASESPMFGRSYVFFEKEPSKIKGLTDIFDPSDYSIMIVSSDNPKAVKQNYGLENIEVTTLSSNGRGKTLNINALGTLTVFLKEYIRGHDKPIVLIENFTDIIDSNGLNHSLMFIHQLVTSKDLDKTVSFAISVDASILTKKDRNILLGDMSEYSN